MNRSEHMQWCKDRALDYVADGDLQGALASMCSDLGKHDETRDLNTFALLAGAAHTDSPQAMRSFIEGFA